MGLVINASKNHLLKEKGLTLVELLIAVSLAVLVAAGAYSLFFTGLLSWERGVAARESRQNIRMALRAIEQDIRYADWVWIGQNWESHWNDDSYIEPGVGDQLYYAFFADRHNENRPHFTFYKIWLSPDNTLYQRKNILLTQTNSIYYANPAPFPLADNIGEVEFRYADESGRLVTTSVVSGDDREGPFEAENTVFLRNSGVCPCP